MVRGLIATIPTKSIMLDTGAQATLLDHNFFKRLPPDTYKIHPLLESDILYATGDIRLRPILKISCLVQLKENGEESTQDEIVLYVLKHLPCDVLMSIQHIKHFIHILNFTEHLVILKKVNYTEIPVVIEEEITIPPRTSMFVKVFINIAENPFEAIGHFYEHVTDEEGGPMSIAVRPFAIKMGPNIKYDIDYYALVTNLDTDPLPLKPEQELGVIIAKAKELKLKTDQVQVKEDLELLEKLDKYILNYSISNHKFTIDDETGENAKILELDRNFETVELENNKDPYAPSSIDMIHINDKLNNTQRQQLDNILKQYKIVFENDGKHPDLAIAPPVEIDTGDAKPIKQVQYRISPILWQQVPAVIDEFVKNGVIEASESDWKNPLKPVPKKAGDLKSGIRICVDFRKLNEVTKKDNYPLTRIDDIIDSLKHKKWFGLIDLCAGYHQIPLAEKDRPKTAFQANNQLWQWKVLPEGLTNAPSKFQRYMHSILGRRIGKICWVYIDDILIFGESWEEYLDNIKNILKCLKEVNISAKAAKTYFGYSRIKALGHIIGEGQVKPDPKLIEKLIQYPVPTNIRQLRRFLGLTNYFRKFIPNLAKVVTPLQELTKQSVLGKKPTAHTSIIEFWQPIHTESMQEVIKILTSKPVLIMPDFTKPFILTTDACDTGIGAMLSQEIEGVEHPVAYISRTLNIDERKYSPTEKECLAIIWAIKALEPYLVYKTFYLNTDHKPLTWLRYNKSQNKRLERWSQTLSEYQFEIRHLKGTEIPHVDALSRMYEDNQFKEFDEVRKLKLTPEQIQQMVHQEAQRLGRRQIEPQDLMNVHHSRLTLINNNRKKSSISKKQKLWHVERVVDKQIKDGVLKYLIKWSGYDDIDNTWEPIQNLKGCDNLIQQFERDHLLKLRQQGEQRKQISKIQELQQKETTDIKINSDIKSDKDREIKINENEDIKLNEDLMISGVLPDEVESEIIKAQYNDPELQPIIAYLQHKALPFPTSQHKEIVKQSEYYSIDEHSKALIRLRESKSKTPYQQMKEDIVLVIPKIFQEFILTHYHDSIWAGHLGITRTYDRIKQKFYWKNMYEAVKHHVNTCVQCQTTKLPRNIPVYPQGELPIPSYPFEFIAVDFVGPIKPIIEGYQHILVIMDYFSRWAIAVPTYTTDAETVVDVITEHVICKFGAPRMILSDRGSGFLANLSQQFYEFFKMKKLNTTSYHPQTNGLVERFNQTFIKILANISDMAKEEWKDMIKFATYAYNTSIQETLSESPFFILFGRNPDKPGPEFLLTKYQTYNNPSEYIQTMKKRYELIQKHVIEHLEKARQKVLEKNLNVKHYPNYSPGDLVWLKPPLKREGGISAKLSGKLVGPYQILTKLSEVTYEIHMPHRKGSETMIIHISRLVPYNARNTIKSAEELNLITQQILNAPKEQQQLTEEQFLSSDQPIEIEVDEETDTSNSNNNIQENTAIRTENNNNKRKRVNFDLTKEQDEKEEQKQKQDL